MKKFLYCIALLLTLWTGASSLSAETVTNPAAVTALLDRIGGAGTSTRFVTVVDDALTGTNGKDVFVITAQEGKPCIKGNSVIAVTTGINWYLNHYAKVNLTWNNLTTDLSGVTLPVPTADETHSCSADYRYYLNYCTFSYSMSTWTWERWQKEIDWMALHGINIPLQIVGLDVVWKRLLTEHYGYSEKEAGNFVAGPCFQAWWGMNNLEGWGGPNPEWWYTRQAKLAKNITDRMRELGMQPVLPGFCGMVPSNFTAKTGHAANNQGGWCGFTRPYILDPTSDTFADMAAKYYKILGEVMGTSDYYSMDPFHEGANTSGIDVPSAYTAIANAMYAANADAKWVIQFWQWSGAQYNVLDKVKKGKLIVLDLFSDAHTNFGSFRGHDGVYCMLHNFGGRTGFYGRLNGIINGYFDQKAQYSNVKGIGATPEAIETVPVLYDALFELPWHASKPDPQEWLAQYTVSRYGTESTEAQTAWEKLRNSSLNCQSALQGPMEGVLCARPSLTVNRVSSWGGTDIFYDAQEVADAAHRLLHAGLSGENYSYDLTDLSRQALTDYAYYLLQSMNAARNAGNTVGFEKQRDAFLSLLLDMDELLSTNKEFMLGRWTQMARAIADEVEGTTAADRDWLELNNARTLITTWGDRAQAEGGGLRDYSYRMWSGMMRDFYYPRWQKFFQNVNASNDWFTMEWAWAHNKSYSYDDTPTGSTQEVAARLFKKYMLNFEKADGTSYYVYRAMESDKRTSILESALRGTTYACPVSVDEGTTAQLSIDLNGDGTYGDGETVNALAMAIPANAATGRVKACLTLSDGTKFQYSLALKDQITTARTVSVATADANQGTASIEGTSASAVTNTDYVTIKATPKAGYDFLNWTDKAGAIVSTDNPYTYYGAAEAAFTANFIVNKWGTPTEDQSDFNDIRNYQQYLSEISVKQYDKETVLYEANECPSQLFNTATQRITAAPGGAFTLDWKDAGGMQYTYLSAYIDLNGDGEFNMGDELLAVKGSLGSTSSAPCSGPLQVLLPYDMPTGITHLRLRFDGAWKTGYDATTKAFPAKATANRMVYDIIVDVKDYAQQACTVTVNSEDQKRGTVDANGQPETYTYGVGENVVLRAYPVDGYKIDRWEDAYGRALPKAWMLDNNITFKAFDNATITARFVPVSTLNVADWQFDFDELPHGIILTGVKQAGSANALDFTQTNLPSLSLLGAKAGAMDNLPGVRTITLPPSFVTLGGALYTATFKGAGVGNAPLTPAPSIEKGKAWRLMMHVENGGEAFNQWGSCLLATGTDAGANSYDGGIQFYLAAANTLTVKVGSAETRFTTALGSEFDIEAVYDGNSSITISLLTAGGSPEVKTVSQQLNAITSLCTNLKSGKNLSLTLLDEEAPEGTMTANGDLEDIFMEAGNPRFVSSNGILRSATADIVEVYPTGRFYSRAYTLGAYNGDGYLAATPTVDAADDFALTTTAANHDNRLLRVQSGEPTPASLFRFARNGEGVSLLHLNTMACADGSSEEVALTTEEAGLFTMQFPEQYTISLQRGNQALAAEGESVLMQPFYPEKNDAPCWFFSELSALTVSVPSCGWLALCLPVPVEAPANAKDGEFCIATAAENGELTLAALPGGTVLPAGEPFVLTAPSGYFYLTFRYTTPSSFSTNLLRGALAGRTGLTAGHFYLLEDRPVEHGAAFYTKDATMVPANTAYLPAENCGNSPADYYSLQKVTGIGNVWADSATEEYYDLQGRRVHYPAKGVYVKGNGVKVWRK